MFNDYQENKPEAGEQKSEHVGGVKIKVIGVGGAGGNTVNRMIEAGVKYAEFYAVNTDKQDLFSSRCENKICIGYNLTGGKGAGANPEVGKAAAEESKEELKKAIEGADLLFIAAGMGGGTGTGAAPVIAKLARDMKILTVAVVNSPFKVEGKIRAGNCNKGVENLRKYADALIIVSNDRIGSITPEDMPLKEAFRVADDVLKNSIVGIADLVMLPALINLDFADIKTVLKDKGMAHIGVGISRGENRIVEAVREAVNCPLLETTIEQAKHVIIGVVGGDDLKRKEFETAAELINDVVDAQANIILGANVDSNLGDEVKVTIIATEFLGSTGFHENDVTAKGYSSGLVFNDNRRMYTQSMSPYPTQIPPAQPARIDPQRSPIYDQEYNDRIERQNNDALPPFLRGNEKGGKFGKKGRKD